MNIINLFRRGPNAADATPDTTQEAALRRALQSACATKEASPELRGRVADKALLYAQQQVMRPDRSLFSLRQCLKQMAVGAVGALALLTVLAWPNIRTAYILYRMQSAIIHAHTLGVYTWHSVKTEVTPLHKTASTHFVMNWVQRQNGKWHIETTQEIDTRADGVYAGMDESPLLASHKPHSLKIIDTKSPPVQFVWVGGTSLQASPKDTAIYGLFSRLDKQRELVVNGRRITLYVWTPPHSYLHTLLWLDADNYAPVQVVVEEQHSGASVWYAYTKIRFGVDQPLQGHL